MDGIRRNFARLRAFEATTDPATGLATAASMSPGVGIVQSSVPATAATQAAMLAALGFAVALAPIGGGADDWARYGAVAAAVAASSTASEVVFLAGTFRANTKVNHTAFSGLRVRGSGKDRTFIQCGYTPVPGGDDSNSPFYALAVGNGTGNSTLSGAHAAGVTSLTVADGTGFAIGQWVQLIRPGALSQTCLHKLTNVVGAVLTIDEPLDRVYATGSTVVAVNTLDNFELSHMTILGTLSGVAKCDRCYEFITCSRVYCHDLVLKGSNDIAGGCDIGSRDFLGERIYADGLGMSASCLSIESTVRGRLVDCDAVNPIAGAPGAIYLVQSSACYLGRVRGSGNATSSGIKVGNNGNADTIGCVDCVIDEPECYGNAYGITVTDGSDGTNIRSPNVHDNTADGIMLSDTGGGSTPSTRTKIFGGKVSRNGSRGVYVTGGATATAYGTVARDNASQGFLVDGASTLVCEATVVDDAAAVSGAGGLNLYLVSGAGSLMRLHNTTAKSSNVNAAALISGVSVQAGARLELDSHFSDRPLSANATSVGVNLVSGTALVSRLKVGGAVGGFNPAVYVADATAMLIVDETGCDYSTASTPVSAGAGAVILGTLQGTGTPEAARVASLGAQYRNLSGGAGTSMYVKESAASANTGWVGK